MIFSFFLKRRLLEGIFYAAKIFKFRKGCALIARYLVNADMPTNLAIYLSDFFYKWN